MLNSSLLLTPTVPDLFVIPFFYKFVTNYMHSCLQDMNACQFPIPDSEAISMFKAECSDLHQTCPPPVPILPPSSS